MTDARFLDAREIIQTAYRDTMCRYSAPEEARSRTMFVARNALPGCALVEGENRTRTGTMWRSSSQPTPDVTWLR